MCPFMIDKYIEVANQALQFCRIFTIQVWFLSLLYRVQIFGNERKGFRLQRNKANWINTSTINLAINQNRRVSP